MAINSVRPGVPNNSAKVQFGNTANSSTDKFPNGINPDTPALKGIREDFNKGEIPEHTRFKIIGSEIQGPYQGKVEGSVDSRYNTVSFFIEEAPAPEGSGIQARNDSTVMLKDVQVDVDLTSGVVTSKSLSYNVSQAKALLEQVLTPAS